MIKKDYRRGNQGSVCPPALGQTYDFNFTTGYVCARDGLSVANASLNDAQYLLRE